MTKADRDELTGLLGRSEFLRAIESQIAGDNAVVVANLDRFMLYNHNLGHTAGDDLLCKVADLLRSCLAEHSHLARIGADAFAVLVSPSNMAPFVAEAIRGLANRSLASDRERARTLSDPSCFSAPPETFLTFSVGWARVKADGASAAEVALNAALSACECAKTLGGNCVSFHAINGDA